VIHVAEHDSKLVQQWRSATFQQSRLVEVDVSCLPIYIPDRRSFGTRYVILFLFIYKYMCLKTCQSQAIGRQQLTCSSVEFVTLNPPFGSTCSQYLGLFISRMGGFVTNPGATTACNYCAFRTTDEFMGLRFNIHYARHWRNLGIFIAFAAFNVCSPPTLQIYQRLTLS
jgi:hypothetical protein